MTLGDAVRWVKSLAHAHVDTNDVSWTKGAFGYEARTTVSPSAAAGSDGGVAIYIANTVSRIGARTYTVNVYSGWNEDFDLPVAKLLYSAVTMKTPNLNDTLAEDRLPADTQIAVYQKSFTEDDGEGGTVETTYWVPVERIGLP